jgi:putative transposase
MGIARSTFYDKPATQDDTAIVAAISTICEEPWSRRAVGYAISRSIDVRLTLAALNAALEWRNPPPGCVHHTDRGSQYAAQGYREALLRHGLVGSMGRRGNPYDNPKAESS